MKDPIPTPSRTSWGCQSMAAGMVSPELESDIPPRGLGTGRIRPTIAKIATRPATTTRLLCENAHIPASA